MLVVLVQVPGRDGMYLHIEQPGDHTSEERNRVSISRSLSAVLESEGGKVRRSKMANEVLASRNRVRYRKQMVGQYPLVLAGYLLV